MDGYYRQLPIFRKDIFHMSLVIFGGRISNYEVIQKVCHWKNRYFWPPSPMSHFAIFCLGPLPLFSHLPKVKNSDLKMSINLMWILDSILAKMCLSSTQNRLSRWTTITISVNEIVIFRLLIQLKHDFLKIFFEGVTSLFGSYSLPLCLTLSPFLSTFLPLRRVTYFFNSSISMFLLIWIQ